MRMSKSFAGRWQDQHLDDVLPGVILQPRPSILPKIVARSSRAWPRRVLRCCNMEVFRDR
jgi:hypothetical protein